MTDQNIVTKENLTRYNGNLKTKVNEKLALKVDRTVKDDQNATNTIDNQKGQNGCVMQTIFPSTDTTGTIVSFNTASENGPDGILAQVYAKNTTGADAGKGMRLNFKKTGAYYGVGTSTPTDDDHELAVKGDISASEDPSTATGVKTAQMIKIKGIEWNLPTGGGGTGSVNKIKMNETEYGPDGAGIVDIGTVITAHQDITGKLDKLPLETYSHTEYKFPFHIETPVQNKSTITAKFHTLVINDGTTRNEYTITIPSADISGDKAGLYTKELADAKFNANLGSGMANKILGTDSTGKVVVSTTEVTPTTLDKVNLLNDVDSSKGTIQAQIDGKVSSSGFAMYLGKWSCMSGLATGVKTGHNYIKGEYLKVETIAGTGNNYRPKPSTYDGAASTIVESAAISTNDIYYWNGTAWEIRAESSLSILFKNIGGLASENTELKKIIDSVPSIKLNGTAVDASATKNIYAPESEGTADGQIVGWDATNKKAIWKNGAEAYKFSGSVSDKSKLPSAPVEGDVYYIADKGTNYAYDGTSPATGEVPEGWADIGSIWGLENLVYKYTKDPKKVMVTSDDASGNGEIVASTITTDELAIVHDLSGYSKATSASAIATSDTIKSAFGKLEYKVDNPQAVVSTTTKTIGTTWTAGTEFSTQEITFDGMTATESPIVSVIFNGTTSTEVETQKTEAAKIVRIVADAGKLVVYATEATTTALTILVKRV